MEKAKGLGFVDAALDGKTAEALRQLDKLLAAGEALIAILRKRPLRSESLRRRRSSILSRKRPQRYATFSRLRLGPCRSAFLRY